MTPLPSHLALLLSSATPARPEICATPFVHALAARALDCDVEIHFSGPAVRLLVAGVADAIFPTVTQEKSILAFMQEAAAAGVRFYACSMASAAWISPEESMIAECSGSAGATSFVARTLDTEWRTLVF